MCGRRLSGSKTAATWLIAKRDTSLTAGWSPGGNPQSVLRRPPGLAEPPVARA